MGMSVVQFMPNLARKKTQRRKKIEKVTFQHLVKKVKAQMAFRRLVKKVEAQIALTKEIESWEAHLKTGPALGGVTRGDSDQDLEDLIDLLYKKRAGVSYSESQLWKLRGKMKYKYLPNL